jgi:hypothetical protein
VIDPGEVAILVIHGNGPYYNGRFAIEHSWPELQLRQLRAHTPPGYRMIVVANRAISEHEAFLRSCPEVEIHSTKDGRTPQFTEIWRYRNWLIQQTHERFRYLVTLDSDAFPIADDWLARYLGPLDDELPVVAVQRLENGDSHSDRCFVTFTSQAWRTHGFDFAIGIKDAGERISSCLEQAGLAWRPLLRTNAWDPHPLSAGIYDDTIYHHAAGGRLPMYRMNAPLWNEGLDNAGFRSEVELHNALLEQIHHRTSLFIDQLRGRLPPPDIAALRERGRHIARSRPELGAPLRDDRQPGQ